MKINWWCESWARSVRVLSSRNQLPLSLEQESIAAEILVDSGNYTTLVEHFHNTTDFDNLNQVEFSVLRDSLLEEYQKKDQLINKLVQIFHLTDVDHFLIRFLTRFLNLLGTAQHIVIAFQARENWLEMENYLDSEMKLMADIDYIHESWEAYCPRGLKRILTKDNYLYTVLVTPPTTPPPTIYSVRIENGFA